MTQNGQQTCEQDGCVWITPPATSISMECLPNPVFVAPVDTSTTTAALPVDCASKDTHVTCAVESNAACTWEISMSGNGHEISTQINVCTHAPNLAKDANVVA